MVTGGVCQTIFDEACKSVDPERKYGYVNKNPVGNRAELLHPNGTHYCELPNLPEIRVQHTQSGLLTCGGYNTEVEVFKLKSIFDHHCEYMLEVSASL